MITVYAEKLADGAVRITRVDGSIICTYGPDSRKPDRRFTRLTLNCFTYKLEWKV